jgi:carboxylesterase
VVVRTPAADQGPTVDDDRIQPGCEPWREQGTGDRAATGVVLTHGFTGNPRATTPLGRRLLEAGHTVEVVRLPGHGTTVADMARTRYADWRGAVEDALTRMSAACERVVLVGHSMGGTISVDLASAHPELVHGVAVINPPLLDRTDPLARLASILQFVMPPVPRDLAGLPSDDVARPDVNEGAYDKVPAKAAQSLIRELPRIRSQLLNLTQPLLVVTSPRDHTVPAADSDALVELVGSVDVERLRTDRSYHLPQLDWDRPAVEEAVLDFVARVHERVTA